MGVHDNVSLKPKRRRKFYSCREKLKVVKKLNDGEYKSQKDCAFMEGIAKSLISKWVKQNPNLCEYVTPRNKNKFRLMLVSKSKYSEENDKLYEMFVFHRVCEGRKIDDKWLKEKMLELVKTGSDHSLEKDSKVFVASNGWLTRWKKNYRVSSQMRTEKKPVSESGYEKVLLEFWKSMMELQQSEAKYDIRDATFGRFGPSLMWNVDQVPLGFVPDRRASLNPMGTSCWIPSLGSSGLTKRVGTLILCLRASSPQIVKPMVVFRGKGSLTRSFIAELDSIGIPYQFQVNAWSDSRVCFEHLKYFSEMIRSESKIDAENLLLLDGLASQGTEFYMREALIRDIFPFYLPPNTTHLLQPIDHHIGAFFKKEIAAQYDAHSAVLRDIWILSKTNKSLSSQRVRVYLLEWVKLAWEKLLTKPDFISRSFTSTGVLIPLSGVHQITIKGYEQVKLL